jgi:hypothetical protein
MTETQAVYETTAQPVYQIKLPKSMRQGVIAEINALDPLPDHLAVLRKMLHQAEPMMKF